MQILPGNGRVALLRFLPDGRLLVIRTFDDAPAVVEVCRPSALDESLRIPLPSAWVRKFGPHWELPNADGPADVNAVAVHPDGESFFIAWQGRLLRFRTDNGDALPTGVDGDVNQVIVSPNGQRMLTARCGRERCETAALGLVTGKELWRHEFDPVEHLAGFLADGERYATASLASVRTRRFDDHAELAAARYPATWLSHPLLSPDGRQLGAIGYTSMYVFDTEHLGKPRRISASSSFGNFVSFAFHPHGPEMAVIHGGPTLVKLYDVRTMKLQAKYAWKLGSLECVTFSADGGLGAAGSTDGRVVVWDVEES